MAYSIDYINLVCTDLGGTGGHAYEIDALNEICTLIGATAGHSYNIDALNAICTALGYTAGHEYNIDALNAICVGGAYIYEDDAWQAIRLGSLLNYEAETKSLLSRMSVQPNTTRKSLINKTVKDLKEAGIWSKLDVLYLLNSHTKQSAYLNWIKDAHNITDGVAPVWYKDYAVHGNTAMYLNTNYNPNQQGVNYTLNSASVGSWVDGILAASQYSFGAYVSPNQIALMRQTANMLTAVNGGYSTPAYTASAGFHHAIRTSATSHRFVFNKNSGLTANVNAGAIPDKNIYILGLNNNGNLSNGNNVPHQLFYAGGALTQAETDAFYDIISNYLTSIKKTDIGIIGDSVIANAPSMSSIIGYNNISIAVAGENIEQQKARWDALTVDQQQSLEYVFVAVGLNDTNPAEDAPTALLRYQGLVDDINSKKSATCKTILCSMTPCKARLIVLYGAVDGLVAYQKWLDMNTAILGNGINAITGADGYVDAPTTLLNDGQDNLAAAYDSGDHIHPNEAGKLIIRDQWSLKIVA